MKDILSASETQILKNVNSSQQQYLELYAKYFAKAQNPENISMTEIDSLGFTIKYKEDSQVKELRATFTSRIRHPNQVDQALFSMAKEAIDALDIKPDASYISPVSEIPSLLNSINWSLFFLIFGIIFGLWSIRVSSDLSPLSSLIKQNLRGNEGLDRMFSGIFVMHILEAIFTFGICKLWGNLSWSETIIYMSLTLIGGIAVVKGSVKRVSQIQRSIQNSKKDD